MPIARLTETAIIFKGSEFFLYDFKKTTGWLMGDVLEFSSLFPENASCVVVDPRINSNVMQVISSGGYNKGWISDEVFGMIFSSEEVNTVLEFNASVSCVMPPMKTPRAFHQSTICKNRLGVWTLYVFGGKSSRHTWLSSVASLDLRPFFRPGITEKVEG